MVSFFEVLLQVLENASSLAAQDAEAWVEIKDFVHKSKVEDDLVVHRVGATH